MEEFFMTAIEGAISGFAGAEPQGAEKKAPHFIALNKKWTDATKSLNFKKIGAALNKYGVTVNNEHELLEAVTKLSKKEDLPSIRQLMKDVSSLTKSKSETTAAKILIAAQLYRSYSEEGKFTGIKDTQNDAAIKSLILGGRWMVERGEEYIRPQRSETRDLAISWIVGLSAMTVVALPILLGIGAGVAIYWSWQNHHIDQWTETNMRLPKVINEIAADLFTQLKAIPRDWKSLISLNLNKKLTSEFRFDIKWHPNTLLLQLNATQKQLAEKKGIAKFLSPKDLEKTKKNIQANIDTLTLYCSPSIYSWETPGKFKSALETEQKRLDTVLYVRKHALGEKIKQKDHDTTTKENLDAILPLLTAKKLKSIFDVKDAQPIEVDYPPEECEAELKNQSIAVIFKTGQNLQNKLTLKIPEYERDKLQFLLAITQKTLLHKLRAQLEADKK
jgi:hypothetical protein